MRVRIGPITLATTEPEWKYVNVCRFALYLERSIAEGTRWAVFEPNGENLWREIRRSVETFMLTLFRQGRWRPRRPRTPTSSAATERR